MAAGTAEQNRSSRKAARARSSAKNSYYELNDALMNEAGTSQKTSQDTMEKPAFDEGVAEQYQKLLDGFTGNNRSVLPTTSVAAGAPAIVQSENDLRMAQAASTKLDLDKGLADLNSVSNYLTTKVNPQLNNSRATTGMTGGFQRGNAGVLGTELEAANALANNQLAQLMIAGGQTAMGYGLMAPTAPGNITGGVGGIPTPAQPPMRF
jgi:hypothetical protein